jgi:DNA-binding CsgD family transcriptional regulator
VSKPRRDDLADLPMPEGTQVQHLDEGLALLSFPLVAADVPEALSPAEQEVALQVYAGASNKEIAQARGVSARTIGNQLESIYRKLGVSSRAELALRLRGGRRG